MPVRAGTQRVPARTLLGLLGPLGHRAAAAAANRLGGREHAAAGEELDRGRRADLARVREVVAAGLERRRSGTVRNAGSAPVFRALRWLARGSAIACGSVRPRSTRSSRIWSTVVMIVAPPGEPSARNGAPAFVTIVGAIELRGRFPPSTRFGWVGESKLKSVSSLLSRNP